jgi:hypothetical protein
MANANWPERGAIRHSDFFSTHSSGLPLVYFLSDIFWVTDGMKQPPRRNRKPKLQESRYDSTRAYLEVI